MIAQTDLCNHGDALGGDVVALQTDLHCGECAPGGCDGIVNMSWLHIEVWQGPKVIY